MENWKIQYLERPLRPSRLRDLLLDKGWAHACLRVVNGEDQPVLEMHGFFDSAAGAVCNTVASRLFRRPLHFAHLKILALTNPLLMKVYQAHLPVTCTLAITGSEDTILRLTEAMVRTGEIMNRTRFDYYIGRLNGAKKKDGRYDPGLNCQTVATELLRPFVSPLRMGGCHFENPACRRDLATVDPALKGVAVDWDSPLESIRHRIAIGVRELSPKHGKNHWYGSEILKEKFAGSLKWLRAVKPAKLATPSPALSPVR